MKEQAKLARPYATAVFGMAWQSGTVEEWSELLRVLSLVVSDPLMREVVADPRVPRDTIVSLVLSIPGEGVSEAGRNLVRILVENQRLGLLPAIAAQFEAERARAQRRETVEVRSAYPLGAEIEGIIARVMRERLGHEVDLAVQVDPSIIGGVVIRAGDHVVDGSVKGRLAQLAGALA
jgi:F-type H+-transporting ATPase subunit delta